MSELEESMDVTVENNSKDDQALIERSKEIEEQLFSNKYINDAYVELLSIYRKLDDMKSLRATFEKYNECFPVTPSLWLERIKDEIRATTKPKTYKFIFSLFDRALEEYMTVELWNEYAKYSMTKCDIETTRSILERAVDIAGQHYSEGCLLWDTYTSMEIEQVSLYKEQTAEWRAQIQRVGDIFRRQFCLALFGLTNSFNRYVEWMEKLPKENSLPKGPIAESYRTGLTNELHYKEYESRLAVAKTNGELLDVYKDYIKHALYPSTAICLFERAVLQLYSIPEFWQEYIKHVSSSSEAVVKVCNRAVRNCPWSEELWMTKIRMMEKWQKETKEIVACFEEGTAAIAPNPGLDLWLVYLEFVQRNYKDPQKTDKIFSFAIKYLGFENDPLCKVSRWHARRLARRGDIYLARKLFWNHILVHPQLEGTSTIWLEFAQLERYHGDPYKLRKLYQDAISACTDWPDSIYEEWLMFERECGSLRTVMECIEIRKEMLKEEMDTDSSEVTQEKETEKKRKNNDPEETVQSKKVKSERLKESQEKMEGPLPSGTGINKPINKDPKRTVFVANLHQNVGESELKKLFPNAINISLVYTPKGKSRCYGFMEFATEQETEEALSKDRIELDGRPVFISELKTDKTEKTQFKYKNATELNKLFVRGLPKSKTKEEVNEIFGPYGAVDVRLVCYKNGQSKGLAYVEFENEEAAQKALAATDKMQLDNEVISVVISAPPLKKPPAQITKTSKPIGHPKDRLQVPVIQTVIDNKVNSDKTDKSKSDNSVSTKVSPKSNADFRKMLLKK